MKKALALHVLLADCQSADASNPSTLWLPPHQHEPHVKLIDHKPPPF